MNWKKIVSSIEGVLEFSNPKGIKQIADEASLSESVVSGFIPLTRHKKLMQNGAECYLLSSLPRKMTGNQAISLALELSSRFDDKSELDSTELYDRAAELSGKKRTSIQSTVFYMYKNGELVRTGASSGNNFWYRLPKEGEVVVPAISTSSASKKSILECALEVSAFVEKSEAKIRELEGMLLEKDKKIAIMQKSLDKVKSILGDVI